MESAKVGAFPEPKITEQGKFMCPICERSFYSRDFYENHIRNNHPEQAPAAQSSGISDKQAQRIQDPRRDAVSKTEFKRTTTP